MQPSSQSLTAATSSGAPGISFSRAATNSTTTQPTGPSSTQTINGHPYRSVVVIGAGASGLFAAKTLQPRFNDVLIIEAQAHAGGRINQVHGLVPWPVQIGPEFVHGAKSVLVDTLREVGFKLEEKVWPDYWYIPPVGTNPLNESSRSISKLVKDEDADEEIQAMHKLIEDQVGNEQYPPDGKDISAVQWLKSKGASERMVAAAEACYANDNAASLAQLGLTEMIEENRRWDGRDAYLLTDRCLSNLVSHLKDGLEIKNNAPVVKIETLRSMDHASNKSGSVRGGKGRVLLTLKDGSKLYCDHVVVTVSLKVLQKDVIQFSPPLPSDKVQAIHRLKMGNAIKIFLSFNEPFWPKDMYDVLCPGCLIPEIWMLSYPHVISKTGNKVADKMGKYLITGFIAGQQADEMSQGMSHDQAIKGFLNQLDLMFSNKVQHGSQHGSGGIATRSLVSSFVYDWSKVDYVGGAYTFPSLGARLGDRDKLARPVDNAIFFAGEAAHSGMNMCVHGAMEAGQMAATQIISLYNQHKSKL